VVLLIQIKSLNLDNGIQNIQVNKIMAHSQSQISIFSFLIDSCLHGLMAFVLGGRYYIFAQEIKQSAWFISAL